MKPRQRRKPQPAPLEKQVAWDIVQALRLVGFDISSTQQSRASRQTVGMPDLYATHAAWGLRFWLEVKRLGGRVSKAQQAWHDAERAAGGIVLVATSAADALRQVERLRADRRMG
jgi:hypothetical protein